MEFENADIISVNQFDRPDLERIFSLSDQMKEIARGKIRNTLLDGKILASLFLEASTRSRMSFASAFMRLGGQVNSTTGMTFSSMNKGETLEDTIRVVEAYSDIIAMRNPVTGTAQRAADIASIPVINAGDGVGEHPTQALLDAYTIQAEKGGVDGHTVTMTGDLKYGRTVHSLSKLLSRYDRIKYIFAAPPAFQMPDKIIEGLKSGGFDVVQTDDFDGALPESDIIYSTRLQKERLEGGDVGEEIDTTFQLTRKKIEDLCKKDVTVMHPLPRNEEVAVDVDDLPNAAYFRQAEYGMQIRMALYLMIFGKDKQFF